MLFPLACQTTRRDNLSHSTRDFIDIIDVNSLPLTTNTSSASRRVCREALLVRIEG
jgi:hypothetical protein